MSKRVRAETIDTFPEEKAGKHVRDTEPEGAEETWETVCSPGDLRWFLPSVVIDGLWDFCRGFWQHTDELLRE